MLAARYHPEAVPEILEGISRLLPSKDIFEILKQKNIEGENILSLILQSEQPQTITGMLAPMEDMTASQKATLLKPIKELTVDYKKILIAYPETVIALEALITQNSSKPKRTPKRAASMMSRFSLWGWGGGNPTRRELEGEDDVPVDVEMVMTLLPKAQEHSTLRQRRK